MRVADFDFELPEALIAQRPRERRDASRLLVVGRGAGAGGPGAEVAPGDALAHHVFADLPTIVPDGALVVFNDARVIPARLWARRASGGRHEIVLVEPDGEAGVWRALVRGQVRPGTSLTVEDRAGRPGPTLGFLGRDADGTARLALPDGGLLALEGFGEPPLPPYIERANSGATGPDADDRERYQTVYAKTPGAVAAPTAGLHFTPELLAALDARGLERVSLTLHVGLGTFSPIRVDDTDEHVMHEERFDVPWATAEAYARARAAGRPIVAVGTTVVRCLESAARADGRTLAPGPGRTRLFVTPGFRFRAVDHLITNFHLPRSTLLMLVSAFAGRDRVLAAYRAAVAAGYRFFSYGDAVWLTLESPALPAATAGAADGPTAPLPAEVP